MKKLKSEGFTIIEVMIVLAIAGLIILVVLLAVPALQRNSRNTALKNDASAIAAAVSEYSSNNNGSMPTTATVGADGNEVTIGGSGTASTAKIQGGTEVKTDDPTVSDDTTGTIFVKFKNKCNGDDDTTKSNRSTAIFYVLETSGDPVLKCIDS